MSRRTVLRGAGGVSVALPWLAAMAPRLASAATAPKRFAVVFFSNGVTTSQWNPTGSGSNFTLSPVLEPLKDLQSKIVVLQGVTMETARQNNGNGHNVGMTNLLTARKFLLEKQTDFGAVGWGAGTTIDQAIANKVGLTTKFPSLQLGVQANSQYKGGPYTFVSYSGPQKPLTAEDDPRKVFARVFTDVGGDPAMQQAKLDRKRSILDFVKADFQQVSPRLGASDRAKLDQHLSGIREIERRLTLGSVSAAGCKKPTAPAATLAFTGNDNFPAVGSLMMDLMTSAFACDQTRVATLQWSTGQSGTNHSKWAGPQAAPGYHHGISHQTDQASIDSLVRIQTWYVKQFADLGKRLQAVTEGDGTLLDNTTVLLASEVGVGNTHTFKDMPYVLMGGCGGAIKTGRYLSGLNRTHNDLFVSLANAMGMADTTFGDPMFCKGPVPGIVG
jgi:hypothetical protein